MIYDKIYLLTAIDWFDTRWQ